MRADSVDLRQKVLDAYEQQEGSQRELASSALSFPFNWRYSLGINHIQAG